MWIRSCIILHNLILQVEDRSERGNPEWRELLIREWTAVEGAEHQRRQELQADDDSGDESDLGRARHQAMSDGQRFRIRVMNDLFNSPTSGAVRRT
jgi:hypothetical protein